MGDYAVMIHGQSGGTYGWRRIGAELLDEYGNSNLKWPRVSQVDSNHRARPAPGTTDPVWKMCRWRAVSTSGFYDWLSRPRSAGTRSAFSVPRFGG